MKELFDWFERQAERERRGACLEDAFLRGRFLPYALFRLRFFLARGALNWGLHVLGVLLLFRVYSRREFGFIALAYLAAGFVGSFWWGSLEEMRGRIRQFYRSGRPHLIPREIGSWLSLSLRLTLGLLLGAAGWAAWRLAFGRSAFGPADLYLVSLFFRLTLEFPSRCYHSGIFAIRRIYRPLPAMLAVDVVGFAGLIALTPVLGRWSFPVASLVSTAGVTGVALYYTSRAYRLLGFQPLKHIVSRRRQTLDAEARHEVLAAGFASAVMSLDAVLALVVFAAGARGGQGTSLFVMLFAITPAIRAGYEWAQLFYFDLKRLEAAPFENLGNWLWAQVFRLAWVIGPLFWATASLAVAVVLRKPIGSLAWPLLPFFLSRSLLAAVQVRAFTGGVYGKLIINGLLLLGGYLALGSLVRKEAYVLCGLAVVNYCAVLLLSRWGAGRSILERWKEPLSPTAWLQEAGRRQVPIRIAAMRYCPSEGESAWRLHREQAQGKARRLARIIARRLGRNGATTLLHPGRIMWYEIGQGPPRASFSWAIARSAGLLEVVGTTSEYRPAVDALREARERGLLGPDLRQKVPASRGEVPIRARSAFREFFPDGLSWAPGEPATTFAGLSARETRNLLTDACVFSRDLYPNGRRSGLEVTALCEGSDLRIVFGVDRRSDPETRLRWRSFIRRLNLDAVMQPAHSSTVAERTSSAGPFR